MNPSKSGLSSAAKTGTVVVLLVLVLGGAYLAPSLLKGGGASTASVQPGVPGSTPGLLALFGNFSQMQVKDTLNTVGQQDGSLQQQSLEYQVLGKVSLNSTPHTKVEFSQAGAENTVIAWFNSTGGIDRLDVLGSRNYTGSGVSFLPAALTYTSEFGFIVQLTNNSTVLSMLSKVSENTTSIGPTQLDVTTYRLAAPVPPVAHMTVEFATIPGTNDRLAVYMDQKQTDGTESTMQVISLTR